MYHLLLEGVRVSVRNGGCTKSVVDVWRFPPMYGSQQSQGQRKSAKLKVLGGALVVLEMTERDTLKIALGCNFKIMGGNFGMFNFDNCVTVQNESTLSQKRPPPPGARRCERTPWRRQVHTEVARHIIPRLPHLPPALWMPGT